MVEQVDTTDLKSVGLRPLRVQVPLPAPPAQHHDNSPLHFGVGYFFLCQFIAKQLKHVADVGGRLASYVL